MLALSRKSAELTPERIIDYCLDNMPAFWVPNYVRLLDSLPKTPTGRIEMYKLRQEGITANTHDMESYVKNRINSRS